MGRICVWGTVGEILFVLLFLVLCFFARDFLRWSDERYLAQLPPRTISLSDVPVLSGEAIREICARAKEPDRPVPMTGYFEKRGWNGSDVLEILKEPLRCQAIKRVGGLSSDVYTVSEVLFTEYRRGLVHGMSGQINISAGEGAFVGGINVHSDGATAQVGNLNRVESGGDFHRKLIDALRAGAKNAGDVEARTAKYHAEDLEESVKANDVRRIDKVVGRIKEVAVAASSVFSLVRSVLNLDG
jgi:hypothetical protein